MEFQNDVPIYQQIINLIKYDIVSGKISMGDKLLSTRDMAIKLKVNPNTIQRVYRELEQDGICESRRGLGTFTTEDVGVIKRMREDLVHDMVQGFIDGMVRLNYSEEEIIIKIQKHFTEKGGESCQ